MAAEITTVYDSQDGVWVDPALTIDVPSLLDAVRIEPGAHRYLEVEEVRKIGNPLLQDRHSCEADILQKRKHHGGAWREAVLQDSRDSRVVEDKEVVLKRLLSKASRLSTTPNVYKVRVFHGCKSLEKAESIANEGFASNLQETKGWFGEGPYTSLDAGYALRYCFETDFRQHAGKTGYLVAADAIFANVYPVSQYDNKKSPTDPGLKGKPIGGSAAPGARGCDAHFVCVRCYPPFGEEAKPTYHACLPKEKEEGTELVVSQEAQLLPTYILKIRVKEMPVSTQSIVTAASGLSHRQSAVRPHLPSYAARLDASADTAMRRRQPLALLGEQSPQPVQVRSPFRSNLDMHSAGYVSVQSTVIARSHGISSYGSRADTLTLQSTPFVATAEASTVPGASDLATQILCVLKQHPGADTLRIAKLCGLTTKSDVNRTLYRELLAQGQVVKIQENASDRPRWRLPP